MDRTKWIYIGGCWEKVNSNINTNKTTTPKAETGQTASNAKDEWRRDDDKK